MNITIISPLDIAHKLYIKVTHNGKLCQPSLPVKSAGESLLFRRQLIEKGKLVRLNVKEGLDKESRQQTKTQEIWEN